MYNILNDPDGILAVFSGNAMIVACGHEACVGTSSQGRKWYPGPYPR